MAITNAPPMSVFFDTGTALAHFYYSFAWFLARLCGRAVQSVMT